MVLPGLDDTAYWLSWAITHWSTLFSSGLLCTAMCMYPFPHSSFWTLAIFFFLFSASLVSFRWCTGWDSCADYRLLLYGYCAITIYTIYMSLLVHHLTRALSSQLFPVDAVLHISSCRECHPTDLRPVRPPWIRHAHGGPLRQQPVVVGLPHATLGSVDVCRCPSELGTRKRWSELAHPYPTGEGSECSCLKIIQNKLKNQIPCRSTRLAASALLVS